MGESVPHCSTHAEILGRGVTAWNAWRKENPSAIPDLSGASLAWHEDWLNGADLREAHLQNSVLRFAALATADLEAADMSGADLMHAQLEQANLRSTNLSNARLDHAHLAGAILSNARLDGARLRFTTLSTADLQAADMSDADLMYARLDQANLSAANFKNARLDYADLAGAKLSNVNLCGACLQHAKNLTPAQLKETTGNASTILPPHLQGSVPWSPAIDPTTQRYAFGAPPRAIAYSPRRLDLYDRQRWEVAAIVSAAATLVITAFIWQRVNETSSLSMRAFQWRSEQSTTGPSLSLQALTKAKSAPEHLSRPAAGNAVEQTGWTEQDLTEELDAATLSRELDATSEPQAARHRLAKALETNEPDPNGLDRSNEALEPLLTDIPPGAGRHAIIPDLSSEPSAFSDIADARWARKEALSFGVEPSPGQPARNPARGQNIETTRVPPPMPIRNPLR